MSMDLCLYTIAGRRFGYMENRSKLKVVSSSIVFQEVPNEISLALEISNCPCHCEGCSSKFLWGDVGEELDDDMLKSLIEKHDDVTNVLFMGGDADHAGVAHLADVAHSLGKKASMFSGLDCLDVELMKHLDYYKIGRFILPKGDSSTWHKSNNGPICFPWSNQLMFAKRTSDEGLEYWDNITSRFRKNPIGNPISHVVSA